MISADCFQEGGVTLLKFFGIINKLKTNDSVEDKHRMPTKLMFFVKD